MQTINTQGGSLKRRRRDRRIFAGEQEYVNVKLNVQVVTTEAGQPKAKARKQTTDVPQPTRLLQGCTAQPADTPVEVKASMENDFYLEARAQPRLCNAQLQIAGATEEELAAFSARMPAADAAALSPVLRTRLTNWEGAGDSGGVCAMQLQVGVSQQLLDAVVRSVYARQLSVGPETAESLLLLADYLQLDWLTKTVAAYLKQHVLSTHPPALCYLSRKYASLGLFQVAADRVLERMQPQELALLVLLEPAERARVFKAVSEKALPPQCLQFLCRLCKAGGSHQPSAEELHAATRRHPELAVALASLQLQRAAKSATGTTDPVEEADYEAVWQQHFSFHYCQPSADATGGQSPAAVVWAVPLRPLREASGKLTIFHTLKTSDGRFTITAERSQHDGEWRVGLFAEPQDNTVWQAGDQIIFSAVNTASKIEWRVQVPADLQGEGSSYGYPNLVDVWASTGERTICEGAYLPVRMEVVPGK